MSRANVSLDGQAFHRILVIRFSSLGDVVMTTAMVRCLRQRFPHAEIDMVVREDFLDLIRWNPHITRAWGLPRGSGVAGLWKLLQQIRARRYDLVYDAHRSLRTRLLMPWVGARHRAYFRKHYLSRAAALTFKVPLSDTRRFLERFIDPLHRFGVQWDGAGPQMFLPHTVTVKKDPLKVGVIPSAQWQGKRWPAERFRAVVEQLLQKTPWHFEIYGGRSDVFCEDIARGLDPDRVKCFQGKLSLVESAERVSACRFVIANDTGLMHVADALGVPSVLIFGPTSAELGCLPFQADSRIVEKRLWCRPCSKNGQAPCIRFHRVCLEGISVADVVREALGFSKLPVEGC